MPSKGKPAPAAKSAAPTPASKPAVKATAPQGKDILKKKTSPPAESKTTSVRRTSAKAETVKPAPKPAPVVVKPAPISDVPQEGEIKHSVFVKLAKQKLLDLKDSLMDSMTGTASETLRNKAEGSEASAFGMHQADAGTDAYDRDFALSLLSQEQDALYEIEEALKRIEAGTYGVCEMSNKRIPQARLEALPFARFTIECQQQYEKEVGPNSGRRQVRSLFGLMGSEDEDEDGDEESSDNEKES
ncbi:MAG: yocK [Verrucomicrobiales bacterium]|nr:yocK [Verrucomicrobiales bacterium]